MSHNFDLSPLTKNTFYRIFRGGLTLDIYLDSLGKILALCDPNADTIAIVTDYTNCEILLSEQEFSVVSNFMRHNFFCKRLICAVVAINEESVAKLYIWREELIRYGTVLFGKVFDEIDPAFKYIEESLESLNQ